MTTISHAGIANGQKITVERTYDKYTPEEPYYFVALLGTNPPASVAYQGNGLGSVGSKADLDNSAVNAFFYDAALKITYVKILDTEVQVSLEVKF